MKIERVELEEEKKISKKTTENKPNKIDNFLIYLAIAGFILPLGFLL